MASLRVHAALFPKLVADPNAGEPHRILRDFHPSGALAFLAQNGAGGYLEVEDDGLRWRPSWLGRRSGYPEVEVLWQEVRGVKIVRMLGLRGRVASVVMLETHQGRLDWSVGDLDAERLGELLSAYLETRSADDEGGPFRYA